MAKDGGRAKKCLSTPRSFRNWCTWIRTGGVGGCFPPTNAFLKKQQTNLPKILQALRVVLFLQLCVTSSRKSIYNLSKVFPLKKSAFPRSIDACLREWLFPQTSLLLPLNITTSSLKYHYFFPQTSLSG